MPATASAFKVQCPSCEARVTVKDPSLAGKKIDCPKCKYRFVVEPPTDADGSGEKPVAAKPKGKGESANAPATKTKTKNKPLPQAEGEEAGAEGKKKKKEKKGGSKTTIYIGGGLAVIAIGVLICWAAGVFSDDSGGGGGGGGNNDQAKTQPSGPGTGGPGTGGPGTGGPGTGGPGTGGPGTGGPGTGGPGKGGPGVGGKEEPPKPKENPEAIARKDPTNLLPAESQYVLKVNAENFIKSPMGSVFFEESSDSANAFKKWMGFSGDEVDRFICSGGIDAPWFFGVFTLKKDLRIANLSAAMELGTPVPFAPSPPKGKSKSNQPPREMYPIKSNEIVKMLGEYLAAKLPTVGVNTVQSGGNRTYALNLLDARTLIVADQAMLEKFLQADAKPRFITTYSPIDQTPTNPVGPGNFPGNGVMGGPPMGIMGGPPVGIMGGPSPMGAMGGPPVGIMGGPSPMGAMGGPPVGIMGGPSPTGVMGAPSPLGIMGGPSPMGVMGAPSPLGIMGGPSPMGVMGAPSPIGIMGGPPTGVMGAPSPVGIMGGPPTGVMGGPPLGIMGGPPVGIMGGPPLGIMGGPPVGIMGGPGPNFPPNGGGNQGGRPSYTANPSFLTVDSSLKAMINHLEDERGSVLVFATKLTDSHKVLGDFVRQFGAPGGIGINLIPKQTVIGVCVKRMDDSKLSIQAAIEYPDAKDAYDLAQNQIVQKFAKHLAHEFASMTRVEVTTGQSNGGGTGTGTGPFGPGTGGPFGPGMGGPGSFPGPGGGPGPIRPGTGGPGSYPGTGGPGPSGPSGPAKGPGGPSSMLPSMGDNVASIESQTDDNDDDDIFLIAQKPMPGMGVGPGPMGGPVGPGPTGGPMGGPTGYPGPMGGPTGYPGPMGGPTGYPGPMGGPGYPGGPNGNNPNTSPTSYVSISSSDKLLLIDIEINWKPQYYDHISPSVRSHVDQLKGEALMMTGRAHWHQLGAIAKRLEKEGQFPVGAYPRKFDQGRFDVPYPPDQRVSWMCELLPYLGYDGLSRRIRREDPWNHEANLQAGAAWIPEFLNPEMPPETWRARVPSLRGRDLGATNFIGLTGIGMESGDFPDTPEFAKKLGIFGWNRQTKFADVSDGLANTIFMIQAPPTVARPWLRGGGATAQGVPTSGSIKPFVSQMRDGRRGTYVVMGDGSVRFLSETTDDKIFQALVTYKGGEQFGDINTIAPKEGRKEVVIAPPVKVDPKVEPKAESPKIDSPKTAGGIDFKPVTLTDGKLKVRALVPADATAFDGALYKNFQGNLKNKVDACGLSISKTRTGFALADRDPEAKLVQKHLDELTANSGAKYDYVKKFEVNGFTGLEFKQTGLSRVERCLIIEKWFISLEVTWSGKLVPDDIVKLVFESLTIESPKADATDVKPKVDPKIHPPKVDPTGEKK